MGKQTPLFKETDLSRGEVKSDNEKLWEEMAGEMFLEFRRFQWRGTEGQTKQPYKLNGQSSFPVRTSPCPDMMFVFKPPF